MRPRQALDQDESTCAAHENLQPHVAEAVALDSAHQRVLGAVEDLGKDLEGEDSLVGCFQPKSLNSDSWRLVEDVVQCAGLDVKVPH